MQNFSFSHFLKTICILTLVISIFATLIFVGLNTPTKSTEASFKCPVGFVYVAGTPGNKNSPLPHNCTKSDDQVQVCENDYIENLRDPTLCVRDLVVYPCSQPLESFDYIIHESIIKKTFSQAQLDGLDREIELQSKTLSDLITSKKGEQQITVDQLVKDKATLEKTATTNSQTAQTSQTNSQAAPESTAQDVLVKDQKEKIEKALKEQTTALDKLKAVESNPTSSTSGEFLRGSPWSGDLFSAITNKKLVQKYKGYGDLCTNIKNKDQFSVGNICNNKIFAPTEEQVKNGTNRSIELTSNGIPLPDQNGLVSYFNDFDVRADTKDYGKLKADIYDLFNNDSSPYANKLCLIQTKALRANVNLNTYPTGFFGFRTDIVEVVADVADTCNLQARTCRSVLRCIRSIHKCEPQDFTFPIDQFNYFIGVERKDDNGGEKSNGRAVQFEPDYENLPTDRTFLPNKGAMSICPTGSSWRPFFVAPKTDFRLFDTQFFETRQIITPFTCVKKGFNLKAEYVLLRDDSQDCGARSEIYADLASVDDSALLICTPPLQSRIKVPACPGGTSINRIGDYTNIDGTKCYKSIPPTTYIVDQDVVKDGRCNPNFVRANAKLKCTFKLSKANFAGYDELDLDKFDANKYLQKYEGNFVIDQIVKVQIQQGDNLTIATSDACVIPFNESIDIKDGKTVTTKVYENVLECDNIQIGNTVTDGDKNIIISIGDFNFARGTLEGGYGCADGTVDIYDCYQCVAGQAYTVKSPCFQLGNSVPTSNNALGGSTNGPAPAIPIVNETLPPGTKATFTPPGTTTEITGTIQAGGFVPDACQTLPADTTTGNGTGKLTANGKTIDIPTNFEKSALPAKECTQAKDGNITPAVQSKVGDPAPTIDLPNNTLPNGTPATFTPAGSSIAITGTIQNNQFVPDPGQTIPVGSTSGLAVGILKTNGSSVGIVTNIKATPELTKNVPFTRTGGVDPSTNVQEWLRNNP